MSLRWLRYRPLPPVEKGYVSGAALLVERVDNERFNGFDEGDFTHYEDIELSTRAGEAGTAVVEFGCQVRHLGRHAVGRSADGLITALLRSPASGRRLRGRGRRSTRGSCSGGRAQSVAAFALHAGLRPLAPPHVVVVAARSVLRVAHGRPPGPPT